MVRYILFTLRIDLFLAARTKCFLQYLSCNLIMWNSVTLEIFLCYGKKHFCDIWYFLENMSHSNQSYLQNSLCPTDLSGGADNSLAVAPLWQIMELINRWRPEKLCNTSASKSQTAYNEQLVKSWSPFCCRRQKSAEELSISHAILIPKLYWYRYLSLTWNHKHQGKYTYKSHVMLCYKDYTHFHVLLNKGCNIYISRAI